jgi:hypothetical protein
MGMANAAVARHTGELGFGNADLFAVDGPINRHSIPSSDAARENFIGPVVTQGRKDEVYTAVSFREPK